MKNWRYFLNLRFPLYNLNIGPQNATRALVYMIQTEKEIFHEKTAPGHTELS